MSGCERGRRTRCERGTEIHPTNRATTTPTSTSSTNRTSTTTTSTHHQDHHQHHGQQQQHHQQHRHQQHQYHAWPPQHNYQHEHKDQHNQHQRRSSTPPAPAPHAGICSVHVSLYAQDSETYSYIQQRKNVGTQVLVSTHVWNAYSCWIHSTQTNMYTQANCENANTRELEVEKEKKIAHDTNMIYELQKYMQNVTKILRTRRLIRLPPERRDLKRPW